MILSFQSETPPKVSLHLDLQSHIRSLSNERTPRALVPSENKPKSGSVSARALEESHLWPSESESLKVEQVIRELLEIRAERDRLVEDIRRRELILAEERARREFTEAKFRSAKCDLAELEEVIRQRERDSRGYLLINQKSMEEICLSFARLLDMLEDTARMRYDDEISRPDSEEENVVKEDIKRRFALIIRKTKSENLKRGFYVDDETVMTRFQMTARYGRSEGNIRIGRKEIEPPRLQLERGRIGDTAERRICHQEVVQYQGGDKPGSACSKSSDDDSLSSPGDRARAIFASFVNGESSYER